MAFSDPVLEVRQHYFKHALLVETVTGPIRIREGTEALALDGQTTLEFTDMS